MNASEIIRCKNLIINGVETIIINDNKKKYSNNDNADNIDMTNANEKRDIIANQEATRRLRIRKTFLDPRSREGRACSTKNLAFFERIKKEKEERRGEVYDNVFYVITKREEYARTTMLIGKGIGIFVYVMSRRGEIIQYPLRIEEKF